MKKTKTKTKPKKKRNPNNLCEKTTATERLRRIVLVRDMMAKGLGRHEIFKNLQKLAKDKKGKPLKKGITLNQNTVDRYMMEAREEIKNDLKDMRIASLEFHVESRIDMYKESRAYKDRQEARHVLDSLARLQDLFPRNKYDKQDDDKTEYTGSVLVDANNKPIERTDE